ncbi:MAG: hypothetical protein Q9162_000950 [Coniocarpon cinnabarinum]
MDSLNIRKSILSITSPGVDFSSKGFGYPKTNSQASTLARYCNEFAADLKRRHPHRFGFWASLPLFHVQDSIAEVRYALDMLNADGVTVLTNYYGSYLGDAAFQPVWDELDRRKATVFVHPTAPKLTESEDKVCAASPLARCYPEPMFEFMFDTARTIIDLFLSGTIRRHPNIKWLFSHAGGTLPMLIERFTAIPPLLSLPMGGETSESIKVSIREKFYFDLAGMPYPGAIQALLEYTDASKITYGSDYCFTPAEGAKALAEHMEEWMPKVWETEEERRAVLWRNAEDLLGWGRRASL